ncbi:hypothetical protein BDQ12DRAFT_725482 [Crucibulum laeve]|uniref:Uncharacterized protein n=1 Tax=Crucibulum laeve TaxID=68775 RepID=A0A5C3LRW6_9AGAR|nr:hypothetical protein BDQ12DRAFT_725482 [Crucibulum laeve]
MSFVDSMSLQPPTIPSHGPYVTFETIILDTLSVLSFPSSNTRFHALPLPTLANHHTSHPPPHLR